MPNVTFDTESEIAELEQTLLELQHHLLSHKDSHEERHILYSSAKSIIYKKTEASKSSPCARVPDERDV
jgi:hypothetical protein